jgi:uncharacterized protein YndB with AHSA1/START domain
MSSTQTFRIHVRATPAAIWDAITNPDVVSKWGYGGDLECDLRPGGAYRIGATAEQQSMGMPATMVEGEIVSVDPSRKLVQTWHALFGPETAAEPFTTVTWEIGPSDFHADAVAVVTVTHEVAGAPVVAAMIDGTAPHTGGGWPFMLSDLKTLLETGTPFAG